MKFRLTAPGYENFNGQMGVVEFVDGLSVQDVLTVDAIRLAGVFGGEWEDGTTVNIAQRLLDEQHTPAPVFETVPLEGDETAPVTSEESPVEDEPPVTEETDSAETAEVVSTYTREELEAVADAQGIAGLRALATDLGVKGNSINGLIDGLLAVGVKKA